MRSHRSAWRRRTGLTAAAAAVLLATGCSGASPGVVAYVGEDRISEQQVRQAVAALQTTTQPGQTVSTDAVVSVMVDGQLAEQIAADRKIPLTDPARTALLKSSELAPLLEVPEAKAVLYDAADAEIVRKKIGDAAYAAELKKRSVKLNPRYGVLDPVK